MSVNAMRATYSADGIARLLTKYIRDCRDTFTATGAYVCCDLGGVFLPTSAEMKAFAVSCAKNAFFDGTRPVYLASGKSVLFESPAYRLYYEVVRKDTCLAYLTLCLSGQGNFEVTLVAQAGTRSIPVFTGTVNLKAGQNVAVGPVALTTFPVNGSLVISVKCLSGGGYLDGFRWQGYAPVSKINTGQRIAVIRTYGNKHFVIANLKRMLRKLSKTHPELLNRFLFVVYDASEESDLLSMHFEDGNVLELSGPNYGGGGNASLLISLLLRYGREDIAEICIMDDDAQLDAETLVRYDAFVTMRSSEIITSSIIYTRSHPTVVQESGGFWGRFFAWEDLSVAVDSEDMPRLYFPYLVKNLQDASKNYVAVGLGEYQAVDFATFIFISFPFAVLKKIGAPLPLFLRNDDVEICLRANRAGYRVVINPNLQTWHEAMHNPSGEFHACLHGLVVNCAYGGLDKIFFLRTFFERLAKIATVKNITLLKSYEFALELFLRGPGWINGKEIGATYAHVRMELAKIRNKYLRQVPTEVKNACLRRLNIVNMVDTLPIAKSGREAVLADMQSGSCYHLDGHHLDAEVTATLEQCLEHLTDIHKHFPKLTAQWKTFVEQFDHVSFWNLFHGADGINVLGAHTHLHESHRVEASFPKFAVDPETVQREVTTASSEHSPEHGDLPCVTQDKVPQDFDPEGYLELNPDVAASGMDPVTHYLKHGKFENRMY